jgi:hypothetical protein
MSQRGNIEYLGRSWRARYREDGARGPRTVRTFATEAEARAWLESSLALLELRRAAMTFPELLELIAVTSEGCWEWRGHVTGAGYGRLTLDGRKHYAHRALLERLGMAAPAGYDVHHACRNTACVNPDHLEVMTPADHRSRHREIKFGPIVVPGEGV